MSELDKMADEKHKKSNSKADTKGGMNAAISGTEAIRKWVRSIS